MRTGIAVLMMLLAMPVGAAEAQRWEVYATTSESSHYLDPETFRVTGHTRRIWLLVDYFKPRGEVRSGRMLMELDCKEGRSRFLSSAVLSGQMGQGRVVANADSATDWRFVPPSTPEELLQKLLCAAKVGRGDK